MEFSRRTQWDLTETPWAQLLSKMRASKAKVFDLTESNPTRCGFEYDTISVLNPLTAIGALEYDPHPRGSIESRRAVARYYADHGVEVEPETLLLTTSTSEAYSFLFRLLCDPGDEILIAQPSYPLFDFLAQLDDVRLTPYELIYDQGWQLDLAALRRRINPRTRAIALVHPNNPTGHFTRPQEREAIEKICRENGLALIVDEVFLDYPFSAPAISFASGEHTVLTFVLSGVSKIAALPQMKVAWIAAFGPNRFQANMRLEVIADTFLSVNTPVQSALPIWLDRRHALQRQIRARTAGNLAALDAVLRRQTMVMRLAVEAGWYAVLRIPALASGEEMALMLLEKEAVAVHPGCFFGFPDSGWLVISLLPREAEFVQAIEVLARAFA